MTVEKSNRLEKARALEQAEKTGSWRKAGQPQGASPEQYDGKESR